MQKRGMLLIACILFFLFFAINTHGFEVKYKYQDENGEKVTNVSLFIYNCTNDQCTSIAESYWNNATFTPESSITISNTTPVANSSLEFHFAECYAVKEIKRNITLYLNADPNKPFGITFSQAPSCNSTINITSIPSQINVSQTLTVGINLGPVFKNSSNLPSAVAHFYDANVTVKLFVNGTENQSIDVTVPWNGKSLSLSWTPAEAGVYNVTVQSEVTDCKCSSSVVMQDSKLVTVTQPSQPPQQPQNYTLTIIVKPNSTVGNVAKNPDLSSYTSGSQVTLTATPSTGFNFSNWQIDGANSSDNPVTIVMNSNKTVYAWFVVAGETGGGGETGGEGSRQ
jgi:archaellum component FlaG (FlaF/FlaG flagellin family)